MLIAEGPITKSGTITIDDAFFRRDAVNVAPRMEKRIGYNKLVTHFGADRNFEHVRFRLCDGPWMICQGL